MLTQEEITANRLRWLEALESDRYSQAQGRLRKDEGFCCLGVALDIGGRGRWSKKYLETIWYYEAELQGDLTYGLGDPQKISLGLSDELEAAVVKMNDTGFSFLAIASFLRLQWNLPAEPVRADMPESGTMPAG